MASYVFTLHNTVRDSGQEEAPPKAEESSSFIGCSTYSLHDSSHLILASVIPREGQAIAHFQQSLVLLRTTSTVHSCLLLIRRPLSESQILRLPFQLHPRIKMEGASMYEALGVVVMSGCLWSWEVSLLPPFNNVVCFDCLV